jgi:hypothetical protein
MVEMESTEETTRAVPGRSMRRRVLTVAMALGAAAGVGVGATALAAAATSPSTTQPGSGETTPSTTPGPHQGPGGHFGGRFGGGAFGFGGGFGGPVVHGQYTVKGPNGYETIDERTGTVSAVSNTSGSNWSLTVKSADGTSGTFTVDSSTSVNGGESGISSVQSSDTVVVTATQSGGTATATQITDQTTLEANGKSWMPAHGQAPTGGTAPSAPGVDGASASGGFSGTESAPSAT